MSDATPSPSAIIADRHALGRNLVRFLLEEAGFSITAEAASITEVLLAIQQEPPDTLVVHENLARDHDPAVFAQIRKLSPRTNIVLMTGSRETLAMDLVVVADAIVEEGPGLGQLAHAAAAPATTAAERAAAARLERARKRGRGRSRNRWGERLQGAVAASILVLAVVLVRSGVFGPSPSAETPARAAEPPSSIEAERPEGPTAPATTPDPSDDASPAEGASAAASGGDPSPAPGEEDPAPSPKPTDEPSPEPGEEPPPEPGEEPPPEPSEEPPPAEDPPADDIPALPPEDETTVIEDITDPVIEAVEDVVDDGLAGLASD